MCFRRDLAQELEIVGQGDFHTAYVSQEAVEIPPPTAQPISRFVERQPWHQRGVDPIARDSSYRLGLGFQNSKSSCRQIQREVAQFGSDVLFFRTVKPRNTHLPAHREQLLYQPARVHFRSL